MLLFQVRTSCASGLRVIAMTSPIFNLLRRMYGAAAVQDLSEGACQRQHTCVIHAVATHMAEAR